MHTYFWRQWFKQGALLEKIKSENPGVPCFLFGHSTGGAVVLKVRAEILCIPSIIINFLSLEFLNLYLHFYVGGFLPSYWSDGGRNYINFTSFAREASSSNCWCKICTFGLCTVFDIEMFLILFLLAMFCMLLLILKLAFKNMLQHTMLSTITINLLLCQSNLSQ